jgi:hypothetical protein
MGECSRKLLSSRRLLIPKVCLGACFRKLRLRVFGKQGFQGRVPKQSLGTSNAPASRRPAWDAEPFDYTQDRRP